MVNNELLAAASSEIFESMGFNVEDDGSGDPRGVDWKEFLAEADNLSS